MELINQANLDKWQPFLHGNNDFTLLITHIKALSM